MKYLASNQNPVKIPKYNQKSEKSNFLKYIEKNAKEIEKWPQYKKDYIKWLLNNGYKI